MTITFTSEDCAGHDIRRSWLGDGSTVDVWAGFHMLTARDERGNFLQARYMARNPEERSMTEKALREAMRERYPEEPTP